MRNSTLPLALLACLLSSGIFLVEPRIALAGSGASGSEEKNDPFYSPSDDLAGDPDQKVNQRKRAKVRAGKKTKTKGGVTVKQQAASGQATPRESVKSAPRKRTRKSSTTGTIVTASAESNIPTPIEPSLPTPVASSPEIVYPSSEDHWQPSEDHWSPGDCSLGSCGDCMVGCGDPVVGCGSCSSPRCNDCCCFAPRVGCGRCGVYGFAEYLYLRPRGFAVDYAVELDVTDIDDFDEALIVGPVQTADPGGNSGYRVGVGTFLSECSRLEVTYTQFESDDEDGLESGPAGDPASRLQALLVPQKIPAAPGGGEDWNFADAETDVELRMLDIDYRRMTCCCCLEVLLGIRLGQLEQDLHAEYSQDPTAFRNAWSDIDFEGAGVRVGLMREFRRPCSGCLLYTRGTASFLAGEFEADFLQISDDALPADPPIESDTSWDSARIVPVLDLEVGVGWEGPSGRLRLTAGYLVSAWFNIVTLDEFNTAIRAQELDNVSSTATFDGLAARAELRF